MSSRADQPHGDLYCLIGGNVSSSPSPAMMNAAFSELSIDAHYIAISLSSDDLKTRFAALKQQRLAGMNVTIPFKSAIIPLLDAVDTVAARVGAVNTIKKVGFRFVGHNTDVEGIVRPLKKFYGRGELREAVLLGAGGAARAFIEAFHRLHCTRVSVLVRDRQRASAFVDDVAQKFADMKFTLYTLTDSDALTALSVQLLCNASPIGSQGIPLPRPVMELARRASTVFDAVYRPMRTELVATAEGAGAHVVFGYEMLLHQGASAFELWTGREAPFRAMEREVLGLLEART